MTKLNLTFVKRTPRTSVAGKPFTSLSIKATEYGEKYLSGFGNKDNASWNIGDEVEVEKVEEVVKGDKTYLNFTMAQNAPKGGVELLALRNDIKAVQIQSASILKELKAIRDHLSGSNRLDRTSDGSPMPNFDPDGSLETFDTPF